MSSNQLPGPQGLPSLNLKEIIKKMITLLFGAVYVFLCLIFFITIDRNYALYQLVKNYSKSWYSLLLKIIIVTSTVLIYSILSSIYLHGSETMHERKFTNLKYILTWTPSRFYPISCLKTGQEAFIENNCPFANCYITHNRYFFGGEDSISSFDAILFNGGGIRNSRIELPRKRSPNQIYIFNNMESADNEPICDPMFDGFFNWTATYKLNSDVVYSYITIRNNRGDEIGPRIDMTWIDNMSEVNDTFRDKLSTKSKAVAWFVSHCKTKGKRENYARTLKREMERLNLSLDIYGSCGDKSCSRLQPEICQNMLKENYYFYLSFENSIIEDYITEKVLTALLNNNIPIVYGGANFSRFLPPGSYIDARHHTPEQLAATIAHLINNPDEYYKFFRWKNHYSVASTKYVCKLCAALNDEEKLQTRRVYQDFSRWWHPNYPQWCK